MQTWRQARGAGQSMPRTLVNTKRVRRAQISQKAPSGGNDHRVASRRRKERAIRSKALPETGWRCSCPWRAGPYGPTGTGRSARECSKQHASEHQRIQTPLSQRREEHIKLSASATATAESRRSRIRTAARTRKAKRQPTTERTESRG
jgi:hypothetical protein